MLSRTIRTHLEVKQETEVHFLVGTVILGFLSIFKKSKASTPFEALNSVCLSRCQSDVTPPVQMRQWPTAFSRISTWGSDISSSCDMKHEPKFKPLQENPPFFWVRLLAVHSTWDKKHRVPLTYLLLRENSTWGAWEKLAHLSSQRQGISSHLETICCAFNFLHAAVLKLIFIWTWGGGLRESL